MKPTSPFSRQVGARESLKLRTRRKAVKTIWFGFGMFGLIGWSVAVPTLAGAWIGIKLDRLYPSAHSWTLTLIVIGLCLGSFNAWHWVSREQTEIGEGNDD